MSYTKIKIKSGSISNFASNLGNSLREPVWSSDSGYNRLFITNGVASSPTIVNPVVKYRDNSAFPGNTVISLDKETDYISFPLLTSDNASKLGAGEHTINSYSFTKNGNTGSILLTIPDIQGVLITNWRLLIRKGEKHSITSGSAVWYNNEYNIGVSNTQVSSLEPAPYVNYTLSELYDDISTGDAYADIEVLDSLGQTLFFIPINTGENYPGSFSGNTVEGNISSGMAGYDCMGVGFSKSVSHRKRILYQENGYFYNTEDGISSYPAERSGTSYYNKPEDNVLIGTSGSLGTMSFRMPHVGGGFSDITLFPYQEMYKSPVEDINCTLPYQSGQIPVLSQGSVNNGKFVALYDTTCRMYKMPAPENNTSGTLICTNSNNSVSFSWGNAGSTDLLINKSYSELTSMIGNGSLVKGQKYRITDYITTADRGGNISTDTYTATNAQPFDLVVTAVDTNKLDHRAIALPNPEYTYYTDAGADLSKWQVWYDIENNKDKYFWANTTSGVGKGVIYRLIDEWGNDCPYDFKNIQFKRKLTDGAYDEENGTNRWVYTFNAWNEDESVCEDLSLITMSSPIDDGFNYCSENTMGICADFDLGGPRFLNDNVFLCSYSPVMNETYVSCCSNSFGNNSTHNTLGAWSECNTFMELCSYNTIGDSCLRNTFDKFCGNNFLGSHCSYNTFGESCRNNTLYDYSSYNTFGSSCYYIVFANSSGQGGTFFRHNVIENGNQYIRLYQTSGTAGTNNQLQNVYIAQGVSGASNNYVEISTISRNLAYRTTVAPEPGKPTPTYPPRIYCEDEIVQADWNQTTNTAPDYIKNKPAIPSITLVTWTNS